MSRTTLISLLFCLMAGSHLWGQVSATVNDDGKIVISGDNIDLVGVSFTSTGNNLVPIPGDDPAPFSLLLSNAVDDITYAKIPGVVNLDGDFVLGAGYTGDGSDLTGQWGGLEFDGFIDFTFPATDGGGQVDPGPVVPEPSSAALVAAGLVLLLARKRRTV